MKLLDKLKVPLRKIFWRRYLLQIPSASATLKLAAHNESKIVATFMDEKGTSTKEFPSVQAGLKWLSQMQAKGYRQGSIDDVAWRNDSILSCMPNTCSRYIV